MQGIRHSLILFALLFLFGIGLSVLLGYLPPIAFIFYLVLSLLTFISYGLDKSAARKGRWRTSEGALHWLGLLGGWPGGLLAQQLLRHKSVKRSFLLMFWVTVAANLAGLSWFYSPPGYAFLASLQTDLVLLLTKYIEAYSKLFK